MGKIQLSTKRGEIKSLCVYSYQYADFLLNDKKKRYENRLRKKLKLSFFDSTTNGFQVLEEVSRVHDFNITFKSRKLLEPPFENCSQISYFIGENLRSLFSEKYKQFENKNIFITDEVKVGPYSLLEGFQFNVEVFPTGAFYIHFLPISKFSSSENPVSIAYFQNMMKRADFKNDPENMFFNLVHQEKFYRKRFDFLDANLFLKLKTIFEADKNFAASFDYHFLASFDVDLFKILDELAQKKIEPSAIFIHKILKEVDLDKVFVVGEDPFMSQSPNALLLKRNLRVGAIPEIISVLKTGSSPYGIRIEFKKENEDEVHIGFINESNPTSPQWLLEATKPINAQANLYCKNKKQKLSSVFRLDEHAFSLVEKQSIAFHSGIFQPVYDGTIIPLLLNDDSIEEFIYQVQKFNPIAKEFKIVDPILIKEGSEDSRNLSTIIREALKPVIKQIEGKFLIAVFTKHIQPQDIFGPLKRYKYLVYKGKVANDDGITLSNFVCKCLEKLGGRVATIHNTFVDDGGIFLGLDLGHTTLGDGRFSNLAGVTFDNHGNRIGEFVVHALPRKENLTAEGVEELLINLKKNMKDKFPRQLTQVVVHRDGKLHVGDLEILQNAVWKFWNKGIKIDVVEIIKSGYPLMIQRNEDKQLEVPKTGTYYLDEKNKYAIMITNDQVREAGKIANPIIIKHKFGETDFRKIIEQVYWFTRIHTQGIHNPTRLPATTLKANNIVSTSKKKHIATYKG